MILDKDKLLLHIRRADGQKVIIAFSYRHMNPRAVAMPSSPIKKNVLVDKISFLYTMKPLLSAQTVTHRIDF